MNETVKCEAAILIGGKALRMNGIPKFSLKNADGVSYLQLQLQALCSFDRIYLSAAREDQLMMAMELTGEYIWDKDMPIDTNANAPIYGPRLYGVPDGVPDAGPLGGLYSILKEIRGEWVFVTACDMPAISQELPEVLESYLDAENLYDCVVFQDSKGRIHPLCGYYRKSILPVIEEMLVKKDYRMMHLLIRSRCKIIDSVQAGIQDEVFQNVNTVESQKILCICGVKNSGKTTYIEKLVRILVSRGKRVAVIKHDGHDFEGDRPGTDSFRYHEAGAMGTAVFSSRRYMLNVDVKTDADKLVRQFPRADIVLIEGMKQSSFPKIELIRSGISDDISCNRENLKAVVTDLDKDFDGIEKWQFDNMEKIIGIIDI